MRTRDDAYHDTDWRGHGLEETEAPRDAIGLTREFWNLRG